MAYRTADTIEHVDTHIGCVALSGRPRSLDLSGRPEPIDRPFGGIEPRYRWDQDLDGMHRDEPKVQEERFDSLIEIEPSLRPNSFGGALLQDSNGDYIMSENVT